MTADEQRGGWRDIATAPKDGTRIDVWRDGVRFTDAYYNQRNRAFAVMEGWPQVVAVLRPQPTHWMPLPAPPTPSQPGQHDAPGMEPPSEKG